MVPTWRQSGIRTHDHSDERRWIYKWPPHPTTLPSRDASDDKDKLWATGYLDLLQMFYRRVNPGWVDGCFPLGADVVRSGILHWQQHSTKAWTTTLVDASDSNLASSWFVGLSFYLSHCLCVACLILTSWNANLLSALWFASHLLSFLLHTCTCAHTHIH